MKPKTEELLYRLLWTCDALRRPAWRNIPESFEGWAYRNGLQRQLARLEQARFLERQENSGQDRIHRLTDAGCLHALGGRDPVQRWQRPWDGQWRMVLFDVPQQRAGERARLQRYLRQRGFGYLQKSVWVTPDPMDGERSLLAGGQGDVESLLLLEARPCAGESDQEIVLGAWDFDAINENYTRYDRILAQHPPQRLDTNAAAKRFQRWLGEERLAWLAAVSLDPLLPERLHPIGYRGVTAWRTRQEVMAQTGEQVRSAVVSK